VVLQPDNTVRPGENTATGEVLIRPVSGLGDRSPLTLITHVPPLLEAKLAHALDEKLRKIYFY